ncbi:MAG: single-stranded-DNA-specific exonuclease RecJ [Candidatus Latescibacterota bacterium]|nr:single-stranded-DNA-specific exonuclease RecJ [Candidatus Latescibacterota bacterium]
MRLYAKWNIAQDNSYDSLIDAILAVRHLSRKDLEVGSEALLDPMLLKDMDRAVERIARAIRKSQRIMVFGDYDVDGISSTALMSDFLETVGSNFLCILPDRHKDGYGLSPPAVERAVALGVDLIITVDNGISAFDGLEFAKNSGVDVVVTDHHKQLELLPEAEAVVNPNRHDCSYPFKGLAGVGVAFKVVQALSEKFIPSDKKRGYLNSLLDLVALGTIADIAPVFGENRVLIRRGLQVLNHTHRLGLDKLKMVAGISNREITTTTVGYQISPRINVAGRMSNPDIALDLLCANTEGKAMQLAQELNDLNLRRQDLQREALAEAVELVDPTMLKQDRVMVLLGGWDQGIIGIIASKLRDKYMCPVVVCTWDCKEGYCVGSARSFEWYDISEAIGSCKELLSSFGGHSQAAGCSLRREHFETFRRELIKHAQNNIAIEHLTTELNVDVELTPNHLNRKSIQTLADLEPFGKGNEMPVYAMFGCKVVSRKLIGRDDNHLKMEVEIGGKRCVALWWNRGEIYPEVKIGQYLSVAFGLEEDSYGGREAVQMVIKDMFIENEEDQDD